MADFKLPTWIHWTQIQEEAVEPASMSKPQHTTARPVHITYCNCFHQRSLCSQLSHHISDCCYSRLHWHKWAVHTSGSLKEWKQHTNLKWRHSFCKHFLSDCYMRDTECRACIEHVPFAKLQRGWYARRMRSGGRLEPREVSLKKWPMSSELRNEKEFNLFPKGTFFYIMQITSQEASVPPHVLWEMKGCFFCWRAVERKQACRSGRLGPGAPLSTCLLLLKLLILSVTTSLSIHLGNSLHRVEGPQRTRSLKALSKAPITVSTLHIYATKQMLNSGFLSGGGKIRMSFQVPPPWVPRLEVGISHDPK